jgi:hypothetical protein
MWLLVTIWGFMPEHVVSQRYKEQEEKGVADVQPLWDDINNVPWEFVVFDEAHELKNSVAQLYNTLKTLECRKR